MNSNIFKQILTEFNKQSINYCVLRNYEFLLDTKQPSGSDLDITIQKQDINKVRLIFKKFNFTKSKQQFSLRHISYSKYIPEIQKNIGFDIQIDGIYWNDMPYLTSNQIIPRKIKKSFFYTLSDEDEFIMYLCHSILGKRRFKEKYKQILINLSKKDLDFHYIEKNLTKIFNKKIAKKLINKIHRNNFKINFHTLAVYYILKKPKNWFNFIFLFFRWFFTPQYCPLRKIPIIKFILPEKPMISFIGPDGSGKTTNALMLKELLKKNNRKVSLVYTGRGKSNILPIKKIGNVYKKIEKNKIKRPSTLKKLIYTIAAPIYTADLLIRYYLDIFPKRKSGKIVITDRYASDILLMSNVPLMFKKFLLSLFPKPTLTFYLYNDAKLLHKRRKHSIEDLKRQLALFNILKKKFNAVPIKTQNKNKDFNKIAEITFSKLARSR